MDLAASHQARLLLLFVLDVELPQSIVRQMTEEGWLGGPPSEAFLEALLKEYETWGSKKIQEIRAQAEERGIPFQSFVKRGDFLQETAAFIETERVDHAIVTRRRRSGLSRFIFGSAVGDLQSRFPGKVEVIDE